MPSPSELFDNYIHHYTSHKNVLGLSTQSMIEIQLDDTPEDKLFAKLKELLVSHTFLAAIMTSSEVDSLDEAERETFILEKSREINAKMEEFFLKNREQRALLQAHPEMLNEVVEDCILFIKKHIDQDAQQAVIKSIEDRAVWFRGKLVATAGVLVESRSQNASYRAALEKPVGESQLSAKAAEPASSPILAEDSAAISVPEDEVDTYKDFRFAALRKAKIPFLVIEDEYSAQAVPGFWEFACLDADVQNKRLEALKVQSMHDQARNIVRRPDVNGWKLHISVNKDDMEKAWDLIYPILMRRKVGRIKITSPVVLANNRPAHAAVIESKQFTIYTEHNTFTPDEWKSIMLEVEKELLKNNIRPSAKKPNANNDISGSRYFTYRHEGRLEEDNRQGMLRMVYVPDDEADQYAKKNGTQPYNVANLDDPFKEIKLDVSMNSRAATTKQAEVTAQASPLAGGEDAHPYSINRLSTFERATSFRKVGDYVAAIHNKHTIAFTCVNEQRTRELFEVRRKMEENDKARKITYRDGELGWKLHISVAREDIAKAWSIIRDILIKYQVSLIKVTHPKLFMREDLSSAHPEGVARKQFTIYAEHDGFPSEKWQEIMQQIENELKASGVKRADQWPEANQPINGSEYFSYRNDGYLVPGDTCLKYYSTMKAEQLKSSSKEEMGPLYNLANFPDPFANVRLTMTATNKQKEQLLKPRDNWAAGIRFGHMKLVHVIAERGKIQPEELRKLLNAKYDFYNQIYFKKGSLSFKDIQEIYQDILLERACLTMNVGDGKDDNNYWELISDFQAKVLAQALKELTSLSSGNGNFESFTTKQHPLYKKILEEASENQKASTSKPGFFSAASMQSGTSLAQYEKAYAECATKCAAKSRPG